MKYALLSLFVVFSLGKISAKPRVFIFTDINIDAGDPDDRQSLIHLLWYADELEITGIVPDRWDAQGYEACQLVIDAYESDYQDYGLKEKNYPAPEKIEKLVATDMNHAIKLFHNAASEENDPLYVLVWGNMQSFKKALLEKPEMAKNIRLITIGTGLMLESNIQHMPEDWEKSAPCKQMNWNAFGRNDIYNDSRFNGMWWLEINWTYEGMFSGEEPALMFEKLAKYGKLGAHIKEVVENHPWAQYFRVGDTPSVLYVIDTGHNLNDPTQSSWAGKFVKSFPNERPNYYADSKGDVDWSYSNPCSTWENHVKVRDVAAQTLEERRAEMYEALLDKLDKMYLNQTN